MSEQVIHCPVAHPDRSNLDTRSSRYDLVASAAQRHIDEPGNHDEINDDLRTGLASHYELMSQARPDQARQKVARGVRAATFIAFFHIAAEPLAQGEQPVESEDWDAYPFRHTKFTARPTQQFAKRVAASMLDRFRESHDDMLNADGPLSVYRGLASILPDVLEEFHSTTPEADLNPSYRTDLPNWFMLAAEDNAAAQLDVLIIAGNACRVQQPQASAYDMAAFALSNIDTLTQAASVNGHTSAALSIREEPEAPGFGFGRKQTVVEYEAALAENRPASSTSGVLNVVPTVNWGGSLKSGAWREPGYCAAYPELSSHLVPELRFRTIAVELAAATAVAKETIYSQWPQS